jgi:tRNA C32,U32 (ribose-2'-O)-methylase TrmJ
MNRARVDRVEINILRGILSSVEKMDPPTNQPSMQANYAKNEPESDDV